MKSCASFKDAAVAGSRCSCNIDKVGGAPRWIGCQPSFVLPQGGWQVWHLLARWQRYHIDESCVRTRKHSGSGDEIIGLGMIISTIPKVKSGFERCRSGTVDFHWEACACISFHALTAPGGGVRAHAVVSTRAQIRLIVHNLCCLAASAFCMFG